MAIYASHEMHYVATIRPQHDLTPCLVSRNGGRLPRPRQLRNAAGNAAPHSWANLRRQLLECCYGRAIVANLILTLG